MRWRTLAGLAAGAGALAWGVGAVWPAAVPVDAPSGIVQPLIVERVVSGDTLVLDSPWGGAQVGTLGRVTVRLLGLDAPDPGVPNECFAITSRAALTSLLPPGSTAWVLTDEVPQDVNGLWLAWVWTSDGTFVNQVLVANGLSRVSDPTPNTSRWPAVAQAAEQAYRRQAGLWAECAP